MANEKKVPGLLVSILTLKCPRCRQGNLFVVSNPYKLRTMMKMPERCTVCNHKFMEQPAFFFGTAYVSYALSIAVSVASFIAWYLFVGISSQDSRVFWWFFFNAILLVLLQPVLQRVSRSIWIAIFVSYSPEWKNKNEASSFK